MSCHEALKEKGYRLTPQRSLILDVLHQADKHISAEEILAEVRARYPKVNKSTVYRTLELLKRLGLVDETDLGQGRLCYHHVDKGHHHHLVCQRCGRVLDIDEEMLDPLKKAIIEKYNFMPDIRHLVLHGYCLTCK
ncbi:MAG: Fur family transcriptional regulator [Dehalococcoidia bacterium]